MCKTFKILFYVQNVSQTAPTGEVYTVVEFNKYFWTSNDLSFFPKVK